MHIIINGIEKNVPENATVSDLFNLTDINSEQVVVEQNGTIIAPEHYDKAQLSNGDVVELIQFVGGG